VYANRLHMLLGLVLAAAVAGCPEKKPVSVVPPEEPIDYWRQLPPGELGLVKLTNPAMWPDFGQGFAHKTNLEQAAMYSLEYLSKPSSRQFYPYGEITHAQAVASIRAFIEVLQTASSPQELDRMIKERFDIYASRGCDERGTVLFTGYYRPIFDARLKPDAEFRYPLYRAPPDLVRNPVTGECSRKGGGPHFSRAEVNAGALANQGLELCYVRDPFEAYIITVQGSARLRMADGTFFDIGYSGNNGHEYTSIGQKLVEQGALRPEDLSLQGLIRYFKENPGQFEQAVAVNKRYVYFEPRAGGPYGSLNVPVTPYRSIAVDKQVFPRANVAFIETQLPARGAGGAIRQHHYAGFAMDQDTGGAIRAAGRCDVFMGTGPEVGELAGRTFAEGKLYYIFLKSGGSGSNGGSGTVASPLPPDAPPPDSVNEGF